MPTLVTNLLITLAAATNASHGQACDIGHAALRDLPPRQIASHDIYYAGADRPATDILSLCPDLQKELPEGYPQSDADARSRASVGAPIAGRVIEPAYIYSVSLGGVSRDGKTATIYFDLSCTGLCGGRSVAHYVKTPRGWRRQGEIRTLFVS